MSNTVFYVSFSNVLLGIPATYSFLPSDEQCQDKFLSLISFLSEIGMSTLLVGEKYKQTIEILKSHAILVDFLD